MISGHQMAIIRVMRIFSVAEAKNNLSDLIDRALKGEGVVISRHGAPVVEIRALKTVPSQMSEADIQWVRKRRATLRAGAKSATETVTEMRDEDFR